MKILHAVEFYWPHVGGAQEVVRQISEAMVRKGHEVTVATTFLENRESKTHAGVKIQEFKITGNWTHGILGESESYLEWVKSEKFDIILMYAAQQWTTDALLPHLDEIPGRKILVPCGFSGLGIGIYQRYFENLRQWIQSVDTCVILSESYQDTLFLRETGYQKIRLIPNGASAEEFGPIAQRRGKMRKALGITQKTRLLLHVGSHTGFKGHDELVETFRKANIRDACLLLVGNPLSRRCYWKCQLKSWLSRVNPAFILSRKKMVVMEAPRDKTLDAFADADLFVFFSNVECSPIVLFEAAAAGVFFLSSDAGNSQEIQTWLHSGDILPTQPISDGKRSVNLSEAARRLESLLADPNALQKSGEIGRKAWQKDFTWEAIAMRYLDLYKEVIG